MPSEFIYIVGGSLLVVVVALVAASIAERRRRDNLADLARQSGWDFNAEGGFVEQDYGACRLMTLGHSRRLRNLITGGRRQDAFCAFDYRYVRGHGKHRQIYHQTVVAYALPEPLPVFFISPESRLNWIAESFGSQDIDLPHDLEFSRQYVLRGPDEPALLDWFNLRRTEAVRRFGRACIECDGGHLLVYRPRKRLKPGEYRTFLDETRQLRDTLIRG